jgi:hypothetical protein
VTEVAAIGQYVQVSKMRQPSIESNGYYRQGRSRSRQQSRKERGGAGIVPSLLISTALADLAEDFSCLVLWILNIFVWKSTGT